MAIEAFVLPYLGRSAGVVFWEPTRAAARERRRAPTAAEQIEVYAPGPLSAGELVELQDAFVASLGRAYGGGGGRRLLAWWWVAGIAVALMLAWRAYTIGPGLAPVGFAWLSLAAAATALPFGTTLWSSGLPRKDALRARRLARRAGEITIAAGEDPRQKERIAAVWRVGKRVSGPAARQLGELEAQCREQVWPAGAAFYAERRRAVEGPVAGSGGRGLSRLRRGGRPERAARTYALVEMRAW
jgi:hypothetical protein